MHITRRAPELSATSSSVVICIMFYSDAFPRALLHPLERFPGLQLGKRTAFADADDIARLELALFVMGMIFLRTAHGLAENRMREATLHLHHDGLGILVADHDAL